MLTLNLLPLTFLLMLHNASSFREYSKQDLANLRDQVKGVFYHAYNGYLNHAFPYDELRPLSCDGIDTWGSYSLTLIDALDTLAIMGNYSEFSRVVDLITERANFDININVSVFETNIRIVGGLLSAHLFSEKAGLKLEPGWPCNGPLLRLAEDVARRLLPAFDTVTGMPYGTVNLRSGVPIGETPVTCTAGVGTYIVEFGTLSRLTGDPVYEEVALNALRSLYKRRSNIGLFGNHIDTKTGIWTAQDSGIGAGVDSYFEYLVKGAILFQRPELLAMFNEVRGPIEKYLKRDDWYMWVSMHKGQFTLPVFQSLEAFWPGVLSLVGDVNGAMKSLHNYHQVWKQYGFLPEFYNIVNSEASTNRESYPLRPELVESVMYLHRATGDPYLLDVGEDMLRSIQHSSRTPCGYATIRNVVDHSQEDRMESFFLAETTKYLYLLFDTENFIHNDGSQGKVFETDAGKMCVLGAGGYVFNTEAHPIDLSALHCCSDEKLGDMNVEIRRRDKKVEKKEIEENGAAEKEEKTGNQNTAEDSAGGLDEGTENGQQEPVIKITKIPTVEGVRKTDATLRNRQTKGTEEKTISGEPSLLDKIQERFAQLENKIEENSNAKSMKDKVSIRETDESFNTKGKVLNGDNNQHKDSTEENSQLPERKDQLLTNEKNEHNYASTGQALNREEQMVHGVNRENIPSSPQNTQQNRKDQMFNEENKLSTQINQKIQNEENKQSTQQNQKNLNQKDQNEENKQSTQQNQKDLNQKDQNEENKQATQKNQKDQNEENKPSTQKIQNEESKQSTQQNQKDLNQNEENKPSTQKNQKTQNEENKQSTQQNQKDLNQKDQNEENKHSTQQNQKDQNEENKPSTKKNQKTQNEENKQSTQQNKQSTQQNQKDQNEENKPSTQQQEDQMTLEERMTRMSLDTLYNDSLRIINEELSGLAQLDQAGIHRALLGSAQKLRANQKTIDAILREDLQAVKRGLLNTTGDPLEKLKNLEKLQDKLGAMRLEHEKLAALNSMYTAKLRQIHARSLELQGSSPDESWERVRAVEREMEKVIAAQASRGERVDLGDPVGPEVFKGPSVNELSDVKISVNSSMKATPDEDNGTLEDFHKQSPADFRVHKPDGNAPFKSYLVEKNQLDDQYLVEENQSGNHFSDSIDAKNTFNPSGGNSKNPSDGISVSENLHKDNSATENIPGFSVDENEDQCAGLENDSLRLCQLSFGPPALVFNPQSLYAKIKSQDAAHSTAGVRGASYALLTCAPQPFFTRWSLRGEFFDPPLST